MAKNKTITTTDGVKLYYQTSTVHSKPYTLFFLHGIGGDLDAWQFIIPYLNKMGYSTIAMDLRGNGLSDHPKKPKDYTLIRLAKDVLEIAKAESLGKFVLIGHCYGGTVALKYAALYPKTLSSLIVMSASIKPPFYIIGKPIQKIANFLIDNLSKISPKPISPRHSYYPPGKHHRDYEIGGLIRTLYRNSARCYLLASKEAINLDLKEELPKINVPTLVVVGEHDHIYPAGNSKQIHALIPGSKLEIIKNTNHVLPLNNSKDVTKLILDFAA